MNATPIRCAPDATSSDPAGQPSRRLVVLLTALAITVIWFSLGDNPLHGRSEGRYAVVSMNMANGAGWLVPVFMNGPHLTKPPLTYWLEATCLRVLGYEEWSLRTPSAVAGSLTLLLVLWIGGRLHGRRRGVLAMGVLAMMPMHLVMSRLTLTDALLALFWNATLVFGLLCVEEPRRKRWPALMWLAVALGLLTKGPLALVPVGLLALWTALAESLTTPAAESPSATSGPAARRPWRQAPLAASKWIACRLAPSWCRGLVSLRIAWGLPLALIPLAVWVGLVLWHHPGAIDIWVYEMFARIKGAKDLHEQPIYYFVPVFLGGLFPATLMMNLPGLNHTWTSARESLRQRQREVLWALAVVVPFVMFSLITGKLASYMLPLCAPMALLAAQSLERWLTGEADERQPRTRPPWAIEPYTVCMALMLVAAVIAAWWLLGRTHVWVATPLAVLLCVAGWGWSVWRRRPEARGIVLTLIFVGACGLAMWAAEVEDMVTSPPGNPNLLRRIEQRTGLRPPLNLVLVDHKDATLTYYNRRPAPTVAVDELPDLARRHADGLIVLVKDKDWERLAQQRPEVTALFRQAMVWSVWPSDLRRLVLRPAAATRLSDSP